MISSARGQRSPAAREMCPHHSGPPNRLRPAFKASTLSLGMRGSTIATTIAHSIDTHGWARISLPGYTNLVLRRARPIFACASASGKNPPTKILRNQGLQKPEIREKLREITRDKILFIMITKVGKVRRWKSQKSRENLLQEESQCESIVLLTAVIRL